jgi:hypothetical protein
MTEEEFFQLGRDVDANRVRFDPAECRVKRGRVWLPGIGWVRSPDARPLPSGSRLTVVSAIVGNEGWVIEYEVERNQ